MAHLKDENSRIYDESAQLNQQQEKLRVELEAVKNEKEQLINISEILRLKLKEMEETRKVFRSVCIGIMLCIMLCRLHRLQKNMERSV